MAAAKAVSILSAGDTFFLTRHMPEGEMPAYFQQAADAFLFPPPRPGLRDPPGRRDLQDLPAPQVLPGLPAPQGQPGPQEPPAPQGLPDPQALRGLPAPQDQRAAPLPQHFFPPTPPPPRRAATTLPWNLTRIQRYPALTFPIRPAAAILLSPAPACTPRHSTGM